MSSPRRHVQAFVALGFVVLAAGCGSDADEPPSRRPGASDTDVQAVRNVVEVANRSFGDRDYQRTCRQYTERAQRQIRDAMAADTCIEAWRAVATAMAETMTPAQIQATIEYGVEDVEIAGDTATARYGEPPEAIRELDGIKAR